MSLPVLPFFVKYLKLSETGWTVSVKSTFFQKFSVKFCSGLYLRHSNTRISKLFHCSSVCLGSSSCQCVIYCAASNRVFSRISLYLAPSILCPFLKKIKVIVLRVNQFCSLPKCLFSEIFKANPALNFSTTKCLICLLFLDLVH